MSVVRISLLPYTIEEDRLATVEALPAYNIPGRILFRFYPAHEIELLDLEGDRAPFWLMEGGFAERTIADLVDLELEGVYVLEGVIGHFSRDYWGECDEEWTFDLCRRATQSEIETEALDDAA